MKETNNQPIAIIPRNYKATRKFLGFASFRNLAEGALVGAFIYFLSNLIPISGPGKISLILILVMSSSVLTMVGKRGDPASTFIFKVIRFRKNRRQTLYERNFYPNSDTTNKTYTQNIIPEMTVDGEVIKLKDGRLVTIVEIFPLNFHTKEEGAKRAIIASFHSWLKVCPYKWQLKIVSSKANASDHTTLVKEKLNNERSKEALRIGIDYINHVEYFTKRFGLDKKFYFILSDNGLTESSRSNEERKKNLIYEMNQLKIMFSSMGHDMPILDTKEKSEAEIKDILYSFYNPKSKEYISLDSRMQKVYSDFKLRSNDIEVKDIPLSYVIAPRNIDFSKKDYIVIDGVYRTYYYIPSDSYPTEIYDMAWLSVLKDIEGFNLDIFSVESQENSLNMDLRGSLVSKSINAASKKSSNTSKVESFLAKRESLNFIRKALSRDEKIFNMAILVTIEDRTLIGLSTKIKDVKRAFKIRGVNKLIPLWYEEELGFMSSCFTNNLATSISKKADQNINSASLATLYPMTAFKIHEPKGIFLGGDPVHSTPVTIDLYDKNLDSANLAILGSTGKGKTMTVCVLAERYRIMGVPIFIIAPKKAHEYIPLASIYPDAQFITISDGSSDCINVMDIRPLNDEMERLLSGQLFKPQSRLNAKIDELEVVFEIMYPSASETQKQIFNNCCMKTYENFGITKDNDSIFADKDKNILKEMPILGDLVDTVNKVVLETNSQDAIDIATVLSRFTTGSSQTFNGQTNVNLEASIVIINVEQLSDKLKPLGMFIATSVLKGELERNRASKKMLIIDEFSFLIGKSADKRTANYVATWAKLIRGLGGSLVLASQELDDLDTDVGRIVLNACESMLILGLKAEQARKIQELLGLSESQKNAITTFTRGKGLLIRNGSISNISIQISKREEMTFTTNRELLEQKLEIIKKQMEARNDKKTKIN